MQDNFTLEIQGENKKETVEESNKIILRLIEQLVGIRANGMMVKSYDLKLEFMPCDYEQEMMTFTTRMSQ